VPDQCAHETGHDAPADCGAANAEGGADQPAQDAIESPLRAELDLSRVRQRPVHAIPSVLECAKSGVSLLEFARAVAPYVRHLHLSDGAGTSGEGLQIGDGSVNFVALLPVLLEPQPTVIPEIWMGHHENGLAFRAALERLTEIRWASLVLGRPSERRTRPDLRALTVMADASVFTALRVIDTNRMGIAFVLDADRHVVGVVTDGDIRHAFVRGINLHDEVGQAMTRTFVHGQAGMSPAELRALLPGRTRVMPILDAEGRLVDYASLDTLGNDKP